MFKKYEEKLSEKSLSEVGKIVDGEFDFCNYQIVNEQLNDV